MVRGPARRAAKENAVPKVAVTKKASARERNGETQAQETVAVARKRGRPATNNAVKDKRPRLLEERVQQQRKRWRAGSVLTLGQGDTGQLGLGEDVMERSKPGLVKDLDGVGVVSVSAGGMHTVCLTQDGTVYTFGCNDEGALGRTTEEDEEGTVPGKVELPGGRKAVQVTAGDSHTAALDGTGAVWVWGTFRDGSGSFGLTSDGCLQKLPVPLAHDIHVKKIASGSNHLALLSENGDIFTVGCAEQGQLGRVAHCFMARGGRHGIGILLKPDRVRVNRRTVFVDVWAGSYNTLGLTQDNQVLVCGLNNYNQLGSDKADQIQAFIKSAGFVQASKSGWSQISFGLHHTLALDGSGKVFALGRVEYGRLGLGDQSTAGGKTDAKVPTVVGKLASKKCVEVSCGPAVSFAVTEDGECYSWGMGTNGQLGHPDGDDDAWEPVKMVGKQLENRKVVSVAGGGQHTVLIAQ